MSKINKPKAPTLGHRMALRTQVCFNRKNDIKIEVKSHIKIKEGSETADWKIGFQNLSNKDEISPKP